ncbi:hypothetical protein [Microlunatus soli]|uniref:hypothetical protein n=1 Tax=Microlunatus soli TaxID=630515 RepID=UPI000B82F828|nr:hypothetical protein [Microlunatus soli]
MLPVIAGFSSLLPMLIMLRLRSEEVSGRGELLLSHPVSRLGWAAAQIGIALVGSATVMIIGGAAAGLGFGLGTPTPGRTWLAVLTAALVLIPPIWLTASVTMLAVGLLPRLATVIVWVVFVLVNLFGESIGPAIGIDYAVADLIVPFHHAPKVLTGASFTPVPTMIMIGAAFAILAVGLLSLRRRDLG